MKLPWGRIVLSLLLLALLFVGAAFLAPEIDASPVREPLERALRETTGRKVEVGEVRYQVFPFIGLSATDIVIPDEAEFGLEPIAYVSELQAGLHWPSLLTGRIRIGSVRLVEPSINLARSDRAGWNVPRLLEALIIKTGDRPAPRLEIRGGRMNFRQGTMKSPFFLNEVDLDLDPPEDTGGRLEWSYEASPARTDRSESGFGRFTGRGAWKLAQGSDGRLEIDLELQRSLASEVITLVTGRDLGLQGRLSTRAQFDGLIHDVKITGTLRVENPGQQSFFGFRGQGWTLPYQGRLDLVKQEFRVATAPPRDGERLPLALEASCTGLLSQPRWSASFGFDGLQAPVLIDLAQRFGVRAPEGLSVQGSVHGSIQYTQDEPVRGRVALREASVALASAGPLKFDEATVDVAGTQITLEPAAMRTSAENQVELSGRWDLEKEAAEFRLSTPSLPLPALRAALDSLPNVARISVLDSCTDGEIKGDLRLERRRPEVESPAVWVGDVELERAACSGPGVSDLRLDRATLAIRGSQWSIRKAVGRWSDVEFQGDVEYVPAAQRPYRIRLNIPELDGEALESFFKPTIRRPMSFLERTFRSRAGVPSWLAARRAEGSLHIGHFEIGGMEASGVAALFFWDGAKVDMPDVTAHVSGGVFSGRWQLQMGGDAVRSQLLGRAIGLKSGDGVFDAEVDAKWLGFGEALFETAQAQGNVTARVSEVEDQPLRAVQACVDYDGRRRERLQISCLEAFSQGETFEGEASRIDTKWAFDFTGPKRHVRLVGTFAPMEWTVDLRAR